MNPYWTRLKVWQVTSGQLVVIEEIGNVPGIYNYTITYYTGNNT